MKYHKSTNEIDKVFAGLTKNQRRAVWAVMSALGNGADTSKFYQKKSPKKNLITEPVSIAAGEEAESLGYYDTGTHEVFTDEVVDALLDSDGVIDQVLHLIVTKVKEIVKDGAE